MLLTDHLRLHRDTCNVHLLVNGRDAIEFGSGGVLDHLADYGVDHVTDVLMTHHHRDQGQEPARAATAGIRIWVPSSEGDLFADVSTHWHMRLRDAEVEVEALGDACVAFTMVPPPGPKRRRSRPAADLTAGGRGVGQQAEALVNVR